MAKLTTSKLPDKVNSLAFPSSLFIEEDTIWLGCQNCISIGQRRTVPDFALRVMLMFSVESEYMISIPAKPLKTKIIEN